MNWQEFIVKILDSILKWPSVVIVFIFSFKKEIHEILNNLGFYIKYLKIQKGDLVIQRDVDRRTEVKTEELEEIERIKRELDIKKKELETESKRAESLAKINDELLSLSKFWFFSFLNIYLVHNTKRALMLFKNQPMTKELFKQYFDLPQEIPNHELEKERIFNVLLMFKLIEKKSDDLYHITNTGEEFLKFIGWIK
jgi:hypothetical protein